MKTIAIAIEPWKLEIFERHLAQSGYKWETVRLGQVEDIAFLKVQTKNVEALAEVVAEAMLEANLSKGGRT